jgi:hypothetical protein
LSTTQLSINDNLVRYWSSNQSRADTYKSSGESNEHELQQGLTQNLFRHLLIFSAACERCAASIQRHTRPHHCQPAPLRMMQACVAADVEPGGGCRVAAPACRTDALDEATPTSTMGWSITRWEPALQTPASTQPSDGSLHCRLRHHHSPQMGACTPGSGTITALRWEPALQTLASTQPSDVCSMLH